MDMIEKTICVSIEIQIESSSPDQSSLIFSKLKGISSRPQQCGDARWRILDGWALHQLGAIESAEILFVFGRRSSAIVR
jgi:hypothetical protein